MTEREKIVEVMAREAKAVLGEMLNAKILPHPIGKPGDWVASGDGQSIDLVDAASRFLARLEASGMAVVPVSECVELLPPELSEARIRELCDEMAMDTGKQPSAGKMRNAVRKQHADLNGKRIDQAFASSDRVFLFPVGKAPAPEGSVEAQSAVAHSPTPSMTENADE